MINPFLYSRTNISHEARKTYNLSQQYIPSSKPITEIEIMKPTSLFCDGHPPFSSRISQLSSSNHSYLNIEEADKRAIKQNPFIYAKPSKFFEIVQQHNQGGLTVWQRKKYLMRQEGNEQPFAPQQNSKFAQYRQGPPQKAKNQSTRYSKLGHESQYLSKKSNLKSMLTFNRTTELEEQDDNQKLISEKYGEKIPYSRHEQSQGAQPFQLRKTLSQIRDQRLENADKEYGTQFHDNGRFKDKGQNKQSSLIQKLIKTQSARVQTQQGSFLRGSQRINEKPPAYYDDQIFDAKDGEKFDFERHKYDSNETSKFRGTTLPERGQQYPSSLRFHNVVYELVKIV